MRYFSRNNISFERSVFKNKQIIMVEVGVKIVPATANENVRFISATSGLANGIALTIGDMRRQD